jgi:hypothetical protein
MSTLQELTEINNSIDWAKANKMYSMLDVLRERRNSIILLGYVGY